MMKASYPSCFLLSIAFVMIWVIPGYAQADQTSFLASVVKIDITPEESKWMRGYAPRQSNGVHDRIYHRIVAMDNGQKQFFLISTDISSYTPSLYHEICEELERETGIKEEQVWWTTTHTHSAPMVGPPGVVKLMLPKRDHSDPNPENTQWVTKQLIEGIKEARATLEPARLGVGTGWSRANINRRAEDVDGSISLGMNPDRPVDRQINLIRLERPDGSPIALIANYAIHGTALGGENLKISGDVQGIVAEYVEEKLGAPMLFINGAAGNVAPLYSGRPDFAHLTEFNVLLGDKILEANASIRNTTAEVSLSLYKKIIETPRKEGLGWVEALKGYSRVTSTGAKMVRIPVLFLQINEDIAIWALPGELFSQIAMEVRQESPYPHTFYFGYTNGQLGYLPTKDAFGEGGYEPRVSSVTGQAEQDIVHGVLEQLRMMHRMQ